MNWGALLDEIRTVDIDDAGDTPKFSNKALYAYLREAVGDYSQFLPLRKVDVTLVQDLSNLKKFALPADFLSEVSVACPADRLLEPQRGRLGTNVQPGNRPFFYLVENKSALYLDADPGENDVILTYDAFYPIPANADDMSFELTIPLADIDLVKLYIEGKVNAKIRNAQARLDRFKLGNSALTDNPMKYEVEDFFADYKAKLAERIPSKSLTLYRPRRFK
jgi:hypothetical protein